MVFAAIEKRPFLPLFITQRGSTSQKYSAGICSVYTGTFVVCTRLAGTKFCPKKGSWVSLVVRRQACIFCTAVICIGDMYKAYDLLLFW